MNAQRQSIKVQVLFFGATAEAAGAREIELDLPAPAASAEAFQRIVDRYPRLAGHKLLYAVNQEYATGEEALRDGDELAVFTAVSGG